MLESLSSKLQQEQTLYVFTFFLVALIIIKISTIVFPPLYFPRNIPTIPFYVSFLGAYTDLDQKQIYNRYLRAKLEKYGAVKIYFASRWNILVTKPKYLAEVFRYEDIYAKSGNQIKAPYAVLSEYTGDNVISAHGQNWKKYREVITQGIQFPDSSHVHRNTEKFLAILKEEVENGTGTISVSDIIQKWSLANIGQCMLGTDFKTLDRDQYNLHAKLKYVKQQIFKPLYLNFPFLDKLPIPGRMRARQAVIDFRSYMALLVKSSHADADASATKSAGSMLEKARRSGYITEKQFTDNMMIIMIAGHENPQLFLTSLLYILAKYPDIQEQLRVEARKKVGNIDTELPILNSILYETLRMFPPLGQIINRCTTEETLLGGHIKIPKGVYVGYNNFATGRDRTVWGPDADSFLPSRWGTTSKEVMSNYSTAKSSCRFVAFHGRKRACLGEKFALFEARVAVLAIVSTYKIYLDSSWNEKLTPAGPISPLGLKIKFESINKA
ncbi:Piso0_000576 [Millerozyma farinosa CBS 7064]|uniref:Piso0_000576 protein n=1 Tax=Pichia sorbitophila (strain ATCC MYA-4447 / BCRC 22081 / CBS 7064 / NBRC 10061 / NRRL Y-12695) TaxID=559304 RepID=G8YSR7_PICSO|nr:Piso0_000576 [Millerozyma farinosa CBS 7064]CCE73529.1 Piso0_000576 [Millerozyma farinosa CBS 7064]